MGSNLWPGGTESGRIVTDAVQFHPLRYVFILCLPTVICKICSDVQLIRVCNELRYRAFGE